MVCLTAVLFSCLDHLTLCRAFSSCLCHVRTKFGPKQFLNMRRMHHIALFNTFLSKHVSTVAHAMCSRQCRLLLKISGKFWNPRFDHASAAIQPTLLGFAGKAATKNVIFITTNLLSQTEPALWHTECSALIFMA